MDTYTIDPPALRRIALDLEDAARAVDRRSDIALPPRLPFAGDSRAGVERLVTTATALARAAGETADDLERLLVDTRATDDGVAAFLDSRLWRPDGFGRRP